MQYYFCKNVKKISKFVFLGRPCEPIHTGLPGRKYNYKNEATFFKNIMDFNFIFKIDKIPLDTQYYAKYSIVQGVVLV